MAVLIAPRGTSLASTLRGWLPRDRFGWVLMWAAGLYLVSALLMPVGAFWTPDAGAKYTQMLNVHWTSIGFDSAIAYPARDVDPDLRLLDLPFGYNPSPDGLYRTFYPMAFAVLSRGAYALFGLRGLILLPMLAGLVTVLFAGLIAERWQPGHGWIAILLTAFATPVLFYSQIYWEHTVALAFALAGVWMIVRGEEAGVRSQGTAPQIPHSNSRILGRYAFGLALVAASCLFRLEMLLFLACCVCWCGFLLFHTGRWGRIAVVGTATAGLAVFVAVVATTGYANTTEPARRDIQQRTLAYLLDPTQRANFPGDLWQRLFQVFYNVPDAGAIAFQTMGYLTLASLALALTAVFAPRWRIQLLAEAAAAIAVPAALNVFYPSVVWSVHGLVLSCPLILVAIVFLRRAPAMRGLIASAFIVFTVAEMLFLNWGTAGGREWGARGVLIIYPLAAMVVAAGWPIGKNTEQGTPHTQSSSRLTRAGAMRLVERWSLGLLVAVSVGTQARGLVQLRSDMPTAAGWTQALEQLPPSVVATDIWWLTSTATPAFSRHRFVLLAAGPNQASDAAYLASQPLVRSLPLAYATLCARDCALPPEMQRSFEETSSRELHGLWLAQITLRPPTSLSGG